MVAGMEFVTAVRTLQRATQSAVGKVTQQDLETWGLQEVKLRPHQLEGVTWLAERCNHNHGSILGDEMGLGKTLQARVTQITVYHCTVTSQWHHLCWYMCVCVSQ